MSLPINSLNEFLAITKQPGVSVVAFTAEWADNWKRYINFYNGFKWLHPKVNLYRLDVEQLKDEMWYTPHRVTNIPSFSVYKDGQRINHIVGVDTGALMSTIKGALE